LQENKFLKKIYECHLTLSATPNRRSFYIILELLISKGKIENQNFPLFSSKEKSRKYRTGLNLRDFFSSKEVSTEI
jgi:hypothetical protein